MRLVTISALAGLLALAPQVHAGVLCAPTAQLMADLAKRYGEQPAGKGVTESGHLVTLMVSEKTGSWTVVATTAAGLACLVASGQGWEEVEPKPVGEPS